MTIVVTEEPAPPLTPIGVSILIAMGAEILPHANGKPGIEVTVESDGTFQIRPVGYPDQPAAQTALARADQALTAAGLDVRHSPPRGGQPTRIVRRRG